MLAAKAGASHVYTVEANPDFAKLATEIISLNNYKSKITMLNTLSLVKFIIYDTKSIIFDTKSIMFDIKSIVCDTKFIMFDTKFTMLNTLSLVHARALTLIYDNNDNNDNNNKK